jgi:FtsZ-interacting cell division protein ZipA
MSCGNRFSCGIKRFQQASFAPNRPTNPELHQENESRLSELMRLREEQDKALSFQPVTTSSATLPISASSPTQPMQSVQKSQTYYPWVQSQSTN